MNKKQRKIAFKKLLKEALVNTAPPTQSLEETMNNPVQQDVGQKYSDKIFDELLANLKIKGIDY